MAATEKRLQSVSDKEGKKPKPKVDKTSFLAALEKDAQERARRRKENEASANALKEKGNDAFSQGDYASAVQNYTEGLKKQKDMPALYTNRAQAYIKLQKYEKAIDDCSWALRVPQGGSPQDIGIRIDCINEIDLEEKRLREEEAASEDLKTGKLTAVAVTEMLQKLSKPDQDPLYYAGGLQLLTDLVQACECPIEEAAPD
ncbi:Tetratricopeptide repeat protein 12, partial [Ophiophagus hannah]